MTVLAMHQPNYLPWLGYFDKMRQADVFVLLDSVQYPRGRSVANRNRIRTADGDLLLTVPVAVPKGSEGKASYLEVSFADERWKKKHLRSLEQAYAKTAHFERHFPALREIVETAESFAELNVRVIRWLAGCFGIGTPTPRSSELELGEEPKSELALELCRHFEADVYLSGQGGRAYNDPEAFAEAGVTLRYHDFRHPVYPQTGTGFVPKLAAVDLLFNCGRWV